MVVDPGVGTARRPILVEAAGQYFIGPDNGVLSMVYAAGEHKVRLISNEAYFRKPVSRTFHGRDIFAPVAAHLAAGCLPSQSGKRSTTTCGRRSRSRCRSGSGRGTGRF